MQLHDDLIEKAADLLDSKYRLSADESDDAWEQISEQVDAGTALIDVVVELPDDPA